MKWAGAGSSRVPAVLAASSAPLHPAPQLVCALFAPGIYEGRTEDCRGRNAAALAGEFPRATLWPLTLVLLSQLPLTLGEAHGEV